MAAPTFEEHGLPSKTLWVLSRIEKRSSVKKDRAIPLQALTDPEGSRRLRFPDFKTIGT
jgi:hypothetical protein